MSNVRPHMRTLRTAICTLEPQLVEHSHEMFAVLSDPAIYEFENARPASEEWLAERFARLETRGLKNGQEHWLNWVIRLPGAELAGYVQATLLPKHAAYVAYELASKFWRRGIGRDAVSAMESELINEYDVHTLVAVLKARNFRSSALLSSLGFAVGTPGESINFEPEQDEIVMLKNVAQTKNAA